jgi:hypothetical protein
MAVCLCERISLYRRIRVRVFVFVFVCVCVAKRTCLHICTVCTYTVPLWERACASASTVCLWLIYFLSLSLALLARWSISREAMTLS